MEFAQHVHELFTRAFIENCHLDEASITPEELETLKELDPQETLDNFSELVTQLLRFKKEFKGCDTAELVHKNNQFEALLQKLECEVRGHIRTEHQLQLHIETTQSRVEELEKNYANALKIIEELETRQPLQAQTNSINKTRREYENKISKFKGENEKIQAKLQKSEEEVSLLKHQVHEKNVALNKLKREATRKRPDSCDRSKQEFNRSIKDSARKLKSTLTARKSLGENDLSKLNSSRPVSRAHFRTGSDCSRRSSAKRLPTR